MSFKNVPVAQNDVQRVKENCLKSFFSVPGGSHSLVSSVITYTQAWHCRGIMTRMWQPRQHLELSLVRLQLLVRGTNTSPPIHLFFLHSLIYNPWVSCYIYSQTKKIRPFVVFNCLH